MLAQASTQKVPVHFTAHLADTFPAMITRFYVSASFTENMVVGVGRVFVNVPATTFILPVKVLECVAVLPRIRGFPSVNHTRAQLIGSRGKCWIVGGC